MPGDQLKNDTIPDVFMSWFLELLHNAGLDFNKWNAFLANPFIRPILGQSRSTIDFRQVIDEGKWLIVTVVRPGL